MILPVFTCRPGDAGRFMPTPPEGVLGSRQRDASRPNKENMHCSPLLAALAARFTREGESVADEVVDRLIKTGDEVIKTEKQAKEEKAAEAKQKQEQLDRAIKGLRADAKRVEDHFGVTITITQGPGSKIKSVTEKSPLEKYAYNLVVKQGMSAVEAVAEIAINFTPTPSDEEIIEAVQTAERDGGLS